MRRLVTPHHHRLFRPSVRFFAIRPFKLPDIGEGIAEVQMMEWFVKEGDRVHEMDKLCLVESDKASVEITSRYAGVIKSIKAPLHEMAKVGSVILEIDDEQGEGTSAPEPDVSESKKEVSMKAEPEPRQSEEKPSQDTNRSNSSKQTGGVKAAPAVRALAKKLGVDLSEIQGRGKEGRITEDDVKNAKNSGQKPTESTGTQSLDVFGPAKEVKLSQVGLAMVKSMTDSLRVPQLTHSDEIECDKLMDLIKTMKPVVASEFQVPTLTLTAFFIKAVSLGVKEFPIINSRMGPSGDNYYLLQNHNVSVAMDSPRGLVVPNIKNVETLSLVEIQRKLLELQERAKAGRLTLDDIKGGTISFSNIGVIGGTYAKPVIFDGQAVIGAVGRVQQLPRYSPMGQIVPKRVFNVSWTADHRHVDGASVARFSNVFKDCIENPEKIFALYFK